MECNLVRTYLDKYHLGKMDFPIITTLYPEVIN
jgi:hypothetical protein